MKLDRARYYAFLRSKNIKEIQLIIELIQLDIDIFNQSYDKEKKSFIYAKFPEEFI